MPLFQTKSLGQCKHYQGSSEKLGPNIIGKTDEEEDLNLNIASANCS